MPGLASALAAQGVSTAQAPAATTAQQPAGGGYPPPAAQAQQQQGWLGGPPAYGAPQPAYGAPPQYSAVPPQQQHNMASVVAAKLNKIVQANQLGAFYPPAKLQAVVDRLTRTVDFHALATRWRMPVELAVDLSSLALYDVVIYADDSGSMESGDGERIDDLKLIVAKVAEVATLFDDDGIEVRFINSNVQGNNIKTAEDASRLLRSLEYRWDTKLATQLEAKILRPMAYNKRSMAKPLLVITVTDGEPSDKPADKIFSTIHECVTHMSRAGLGPHAVAFQFAQVGRDQDAQEFLARLDRHPEIGKMVDCTSYFELEQAEYAKKGVNLSVEAWLVKLMVGAIDAEYDEQDEGGAPPTQQPAAAGGYGGYQQPAGGYPTGGYPGQQPPHGVAYPPPQPGYGGYPQPQYPQQQQQYTGMPYQQQQFGAPPSGYPSQQQQHAPQYQQQPQKPKKGFFDKLFG